MPQPSYTVASLISRNGNYSAQFYDASRTPKTKRLALGTKDKRLASKLLARADEAYRLGRFDPWTDSIDVCEPKRPAAPVSVDEAIAAYIEDVQSSLRPTTLIDRESVLTRFAISVGGAVPVARLKPDDLSPFCLDGAVQPTTRRKRLAYVRIWMGWCQARGHVTENVGHALRTPKKADAARTVHRKAVTLTEIDAICAEAEGDGQTWKARVYRFAFYSGLRAAEIAALDWKDVNLDARTLTLTQQKSGKTSVLPLARKAVAVLYEIAEDASEGPVFVSPRQWKPGRNVRVFASNLGRDFRRFCDLAGVERRITFHGLRHGFASHLAEHGASAWVVKEACRHSSVAVSQVYVSLANKTLASELDAAFG